MSISDDLSAAVSDILKQPWSVRDGQVVPSTDKITLAGGAVKLSATILYADLADSTELAMRYDRRIAAKVFKAYLSCCTRIIKYRGGKVRSFDGDRVMGIFLGVDKDTQAAKCALNIAYAFERLIKPKLEAQYPSLKGGMYTLAQAVGVDTSEVLVIRGGVRDTNDLVWVGRAPNVAAKLSNTREKGYHSYITKAVYDRLSTDLTHANGKEIWQERSWSKVAGITKLYRSSAMREL